MISILFIICSLIFFVLLFVALLTTVYRSELAIASRVETYFGKPDHYNKKSRGPKTGLSQTWLKSVWNFGVKKMGATLGRKDKHKLEAILYDAGYAKLSAVEFRLIQLLISISGGFLSFLFLAPLSDDGGIGMVLLSVTVSFLFYRYPIFYLAKKKTKRVKLINKEMSDFFDMVSLLLDAGVGLEGAISDVCSRTDGPLSEEFKRALDEMKRGKSRREAFYNLKKRVPSEGFQSVMMSIIQADQLGVGMAKVIKSVTSRLREQRREAAREQAMKAPVKMLIPMVLFIFPPIFIVIIGPMVVKLIMEGLH